MESKYLLEGQYWNEINNFPYLALREIIEMDTNGLKVIVEEMRVQEISNCEINCPIAGTRPIESDETCRKFEIFWDYYVTYSVCNESYAEDYDLEQVANRQCFGYLKDSYFEEYVKKSSPNAEIILESVKYMYLFGLDHCLYIACTKEPQITFLSD